MQDTSIKNWKHLKKGGKKTKLYAEKSLHKTCFKNQCFLAGTSHQKWGMLMLLGKPKI